MSCVTASHYSKKYVIIASWCVQEHEASLIYLGLLSVATISVGRFISRMPHCSFTVSYYKNQKAG